MGVLVHQSRRQRCWPHGKQRRSERRWVAYRMDRVPLRDARCVSAGIRGRGVVRGYTDVVLQKTRLVQREGAARAKRRKPEEIFPHLSGSKKGRGDLHVWAP